MVKISFQPPVPGLKTDKEAPGDGANSEILLPQTLEDGLPPGTTAARRNLISSMFTLTTGIVLLLGLLFASVYMYRHYLIPQISHRPRENVFHCGVVYEDSLSSPFHSRLELQENVEIYIKEDYEHINIPVPQFGGGDPADIIHDFQRGLTAYHDIALDKCYVIELNTTIVMPPRNLLELLVNVKKGTYLPQTYIIQEEMIVTEHVSDMQQLGSFIHRLCSGKETYRLRRRTTRRRINKRSTGKCHSIRHFENTFVVETVICEQ
ncbi:integral membrane protein 2C [Macrotis lagotis]|uniref:integral membrane protein 2C n=1 Tax=Macrotis lagotis TaxID=92651 RepID=UPI003D69B2D2